MTLGVNRCARPGVRTRGRARRAAAAVEFAVSLTALMFFVFAGVEFFRASMLRHNADCAAYEAARAAIFPGATNEDAVAVATEYLTRVGVTPTAVTVSPNPIDANTAQVRVEVQVAMNANSWVVPAFLNGKVLLGRSRLMTERAPILLASAMPVPETTSSAPTVDPESESDDEFGDGAAAQPTSEPYSQSSTQPSSPPML